MTRSTHGIGSRWQRIRAKLRHGMALQLMQRSLARVGIVITPYYWVRESLHGDPPSIDDADAYRVEFLGRDELPSLRALDGVGAAPIERLRQRVDAGCRCLGMWRGEALVAATWFGLERSMFPYHRVSLAPNEAYLFDIATARSYRGRGLAPYLRHACLRTLAEMGRDVAYSVTEWTNTPSLRFKRKLGAEVLSLRLHVAFFGRGKRDCVLRDYAASGRAAGQRRTKRILR